MPAFGWPNGAPFKNDSSGSESFAPSHAEPSSSGVTVQHPSTGNYYVVFTSAVTGKALIATQAYRDTDNGSRGGIIVTSCGAGTEGSTCTVSNTTSTVHVIVENNTNTGNADHAFYVAVI